jgi:hypothetical protein
VGRPRWREIGLKHSSDPSSDPDAERVCRRSLSLSQPFLPFSVLLPPRSGPFTHREYFFFLYTIEARPPYRIIQISHAFVPHELREHRGVYFPTGLTRLPASSSSSTLRPRQEERPEDAANAPNKPPIPSFLLMYGKVRRRVA